MHSIANDIRSGGEGEHINVLNLKQIEFHQILGKPIIGI
ncbi:hypothetical protein B4117_5126 [Bacillus mycoides]|nr:hypothetical protein B4117_5126 [Bacillus mycoides]